MAYLIYYTLLALLVYLAFSFFGLSSMRAFQYPAPEPRTFQELSSTPAPSGAVFSFWLALGFNSGLPPFGIFVVKALAIGQLFNQSGGSIFSYAFAFSLLVISTINMVAYFRALLVTLNEGPARFTSSRSDLTPAVSSHPVFDPSGIWGAAFFYSGLMLLFGLYYLVFWVMVL